MRLRLALLLLFMGACVAPAQTTPAQATPVGQPIPFSHKRHTEAAHLNCADCHKLTESGDIFSIPSGKSCMNCHVQIAKDSPAIKDLASYVKEAQPVPWVRVYEIPGFVEFNHKTHLEAGAKCDTCHGPVASRDYLWRETDLSMGGCVNCHRAKNAKTSCNTCHELDN